MTIEDSLENELNENAKLLLGGDLEIDYNNREGDQTKIDRITKFATVSQMVEFSTMISTVDKKINKTSFTRVKSVDQFYPLYGNALYEPNDALEKIKSGRKFNISK
ncbi:hypothetical protein IDG98_05100 [Pelagibacterales bacterium SAG-MED17]|nr:hypothetical protein [Pelagibacterales bacterium SAG-MED17]